MPDRPGPVRRRRLLQGFCALGIGLSHAGRAQQAGMPPPPAENDWLVFAYGDREGRMVTPDDLKLGDSQVFVYAMEPETQMIRNQTPFYDIVLVKLDPDWLTEQTKERSVDGIVAYSGFCTHAGCAVDLWNADMHRFQCNCHESQFDPSDAARVVGGPAPWPLAALPLKLVDGRLAVARPFEGRLGFQQG